MIINAFLVQIAGFEYTPDERKGDYLYMAIKTVIHHPEIIKILKNKYKDKYPEYMTQINYYAQIIKKIKNYKDIIQDDENIRENIHHPYQQELNKLMEKIPLLYTLMFDILITIINETNLGAYTPTTEQIRQYHLAYKKVTYKLTDKQLGFKPIRPTDSPNEPRGNTQWA